MTYRKNSPPPPDPPLPRCMDCTLEYRMNEFMLEERGSRCEKCQRVHKREEAHRRMVCRRRWESIRLGFRILLAVSVIGSLAGFIIAKGFREETKHSDCARSHTIHQTCMMVTIDSNNIRIYTYACDYNVCDERFRIAPPVRIDKL